MRAQRIVRHFLAEIADEAWRSPSVPIAVLSDPPEYEMRQAALEVADDDAVELMVAVAAGHHDEGSVAAWLHGRGDPPFDDSVR